MAGVGHLATFPPVTVTFRNMYGISYTLLGFLVVINFFTQLLIDLVFSFFSKHFNIHKTVRMTPLIVFVGLVLYAVLPMVFPKLAFLWIVIGTVIFSVASGLNEVLISPVIAAIPSDNPERDMSKLHSMYAWGVVGVVLFSTLFLSIFGSENWMHLALLWSVLPLTAFLMFLKAWKEIYKNSCLWNYGLMFSSFFSYFPNFKRVLFLMEQNRLSLTLKLNVSNMCK